MNWKKKALAATAGSQFGAILAAATDTKIKAPCFTSKAVITSDGFVTANFVGDDGRAHLGAFVGHVSDLVRNTQGLADHLKLVDADRAELFSAVLSWISVDYSGAAIPMVKKLARSVPL